LLKIKSCLTNLLVFMEEVTNTDIIWIQLTQLMLYLDFQKLLIKYQITD